MKRAADLAEALYAMPRGAGLGTRPDTYSNYTSQLAAIGNIIYSNSVHHGKLERKAHKFVLILSANQSCILHPVDQ